MEMEGKGRVRMGGSNEDPSTTERERRKRRWEGQEGRVGRGTSVKPLMCLCSGTAYDRHYMGRCIMVLDVSH